MIVNEIPQEGVSAPDFSLQITEDASVSLADYEGSYLVLYFYPKDDTPGCTQEALDFSQLLPSFSKAGAKILGVSRDELKKHGKFRSKYDLAIELGSDPEGKTCEKFGVWKEKSMFGKKYMGIDRTTFLIDPEGTVVKVWPKVKVAGHAEEVLELLKRVQK